MNMTTENKDRHFATQYVALWQENDKSSQDV
jgi:hypothetical protein